ncbi:hypothetical protein FA15DRAFT_157324 [Coprinopsis marcescibilis]|uniref:Uncharacterized protein n=1 Tax=Coprinopsis marcescibilis TaxID=230819 RepID=A0A5C3KHX1_COPMA|nr:hypothetical protein FA15DRAFT_157324 [Coprinopsis marcescibilis]
MSNDQPQPYTPYTGTEMDAAPAPHISPASEKELSGTPSQYPYPAQTAHAISGGQPLQIRPRARSILGLLYTSLVLSIIIFAVSMVYRGGGSLWISPVTSWLTIILALTLIIITHKNFAKIRKGSFTNEKGEMKLLGACRAPSIVFIFLLIGPWLAALGIVIFGVVSTGIVWDNSFERRIAIGGVNDTGRSTVVRNSRLAEFEKEVHIIAWYSLRG